MYTTKQYEVIPRKWNADHTDLEGDYDHNEYFDTYREAVSAAKKMSHKYDRADVNLNHMHMEDEYNCSEQELVWGESYEDGKQVPIIHIGDRPIWRWDFLDRDLKPKKSKI